MRKKSVIKRYVFQTRMIRDDRDIENKFYTGQILNSEIVSGFVCRNTENKIIACYK